MKQKIVLQCQNERQNCLEQSQILNLKFTSLMESEDKLQQASEMVNLCQQQIQQICNRFNHCCASKQMSYEQFRRSLGLLGREDSFISRIFNLIDSDRDGFVTESDFISYLNVILKGNEYQRARFGWSILTEGKGDLQFKDFVELFQEISVVWNALTGEIIVPNSKYVEELFNTFDVDQDQTITFKDYRLFFNQRLSLYGWFQYFNFIEIDEQKSKKQLQKVRQKLREKLNLKSGNDPSYEQIKAATKDNEKIIQKHIKNLTNSLYNTAVGTKQTALKLKNIQHARQQNLDKSVSSIKTNTSIEDNLISLKGLFKYTFSETNIGSQSNKLKTLKQKHESQYLANAKLQLMRDLQHVLNQTVKLMDHCSDYRNKTEALKKYNPTKLKQIQAKLNRLDQKEKNNKKKTSVYFGHQSWNLVLNIMVGLRKSIKSLYHPINVTNLKQEDFSQEHEFMLGNKALNGKNHETFKNLQVFKFIEVAPLVFQKLRQSYGISNQSYQKSVGPQSLLNQLLTGDLTALNQQCSTGKSSAFFYLTTDNKIFLKTLKKDQFVLFIKILQPYYKHMFLNQHSLIVRVYGLYKLKIFVNKQKIQTIYFIAMENILGGLQSHNNLKIKQMYDLKGSLYDRNGIDGKQLKDNDWINRKKRIKLPEEYVQKFKTQVIADSKFFKHSNINDYSMMLVEISCDEGADKQIKQFPLDLKEQNIFKQCCGGVKSSVPKSMYIISIIDFLTAFQTRKNLEYFFKVTFLSKDVSCIPPAQYSTRFREFIISSIQ